VASLLSLAFEISEKSNCFGEHSTLDDKATESKLEIPTPGVSASFRAFLRSPQAEEQSVIMKPYSPRVHVVHEGMTSRLTSLRAVI
jgi:hypothetical protein